MPQESPETNPPKDPPPPANDTIRLIVTGSLFAGFMIFASERGKSIAEEKRAAEYNVEEAARAKRDEALKASIEASRARTEAGGSGWNNPELERRYNELRVGSSLRNMGVSEDQTKEAAEVLVRGAERIERLR